MWSRPPAWIAAFLLLALADAGAGKAQAGAACEPLKRLVALADTRFNRLRGYRDPRLRAWVATYRMPGASMCTIRDEGEIASYACRWVHDPAAGTVDGAYTGLLQQVTRCVDVRGTSRDDSDPDGEVTRYGIAGARKTVAVGKRESATEGHFVTLEIVPVGIDEWPAATRAP